MTASRTGMIANLTHNLTHSVELEELSIQRTCVVILSPADVVRSYVSKWMHKFYRRTYTVFSTSVSIDVSTAQPRRNSTYV